MVMSEKLEAEVTKWYEDYQAQDQERHPIDHKKASYRGQLVDPVAQLFEQRMNDALTRLQDAARYAGSTAIPETVQLGQE
jgi:hypothetical protein